MALMVLAGVVQIGAADAEPVDATLERASHSFDAAQFQKNVPTLRQMLAPAMVFINGAGTFGGASDFVAGFSDPRLVFDPFVIEGRQWVRLGPGVATVTAVGTMAGTDANGRFSRRFRFSDTFARRGGRWQVVYVQVTRLPTAA